MQDLKIAILQFDIYWENPTANRATLEEMIEPLQNVDIIVLPEMFNTGFSMNPKAIAEVPNMDTHKWMKLMAAKKNAMVIGSMAIFDSGLFYNRLFAVMPNGTFLTYNKKHLFSMGSEPDHFMAGHEQVIIEYKGWKIAPFICYDLRFPVWSCNTNYKYDLAIYVANWPSVRIQAWNTLLQARAIENQCFVAACNRIGVDGASLNYNGHSQIIDYLGNVSEKLVDNEGTIIQTINYENLVNFRQKFPAINDIESFTIH